MKYLDELKNLLPTVARSQITPFSFFQQNFEAKLFITSYFLLGLWGRDFSTLFIVLDLIAELLNGECDDDVDAA